MKRGRRFAMGMVLLAVGMRAAEVYTLGPNDQVVIRALDIEEFPRDPIRIDGRGEIRLPLLGRIRAGGKTVDQLEAEIALALRAYLFDPQVTVSVSEFRSRPVSIFGAVGRPGVLQLRGPKTLWEVLSDAGGLKADAGNTIRITRRLEYGAIPLSGAHVDETGKYSVADVDVQSVMDMTNPDENIQLLDNDVVSVSRADIVYVVGHVHRAGGFVTNGTISLLEALALAGGFQPHAAPSKARVLRVQDGGGSRRQIPVDLKRALRGESEDIRLQPQDILFVPNDAWKDFGIRLATTAAAAATGAGIYRGLRVY